MRPQLLNGTALLTAMAASLVLLPTAALAQANTATAAAAVTTTDQGVLVYDAAYFTQYAPNTANDMVSRVPGFSINDGDSSRGFEGAVGNVLINGARPASKTDTGSAVLNRTPANRVARIELIRGGIPGIEMQGYSVVVNVVLKNDASREQIVSLNTSIFEDGPTLFGGSYQYSERRGDYSWGLNYSDGISQSDSTGVGPQRRYGPDGTLLRDEMSENTAWGGSHTLRGTFAGPLLGGKIDLTARAGVMDWNSDNVFTEADKHRQQLSSTDTDLAEFGLTYTRPIGAKLVSETRFIHEIENVDGVDSSVSRVGGAVNGSTSIDYVADASETILRSLVRYRKSEALDFEFGGEVAYNALDTDFSMVADNQPVLVPSSAVTVEELRGELFGKSTWRINPKWTLETGLRLEQSTISQSGDSDLEKTFTFAKPRVQLSWTPRQSTQMRLRFERVVGQLNFGDFAASSELSDDMVYGGNANLEPEQRWVSELTFEQRFWGDGVLSVGLRHDEIEGVIDYMPLVGGHSARGNIGDGTHDRLNASLTVPFDRFGLAGARLKASNVWNHTRVTDPTSGEERRISGLRPSQPEYIFTHNIQSWNVEWSFAYLPFMEQPNYTPDRYTVWRGKDYLQLIVDYKPKPGLSIRAQANYWDAFDVYRTDYVSHDDRSVAFTEVRNIQPRMFYQLRVRQTF